MFGDRGAKGPGPTQMAFRKIGLALHDRNAASLAVKNFLDCLPFCCPRLA